MSRNLKIIISFIVLIIGIIIFCSEYFISKKIEVYDHINEMYYNQLVNLDEIEEEITEEQNNNVEEEINNEQNENEEEEVDDTSNKETVIKEKVTYIGYLTIPKINLKKGFTTKESKYNTVSKNIQILSASDYPDKENGNVIIAAHSGNLAVSYFKQLYLLNIGDYAYIEYNGVKYTYKIVNIYNIEKTGKAEIIRNKNVSTLTLITCTKDNKKTQTIYISELINKE